MGRDDLLLERVGAGTAPPTLRFYQWEPATISLGYFQKYADYEALPPPAGDLPVVRRPTGGGAILHDQELTYALVVPMGHALLAGGPNCLYERVHAALIAALDGEAVRAAPCGVSDDSGAAKGPFFCFARRHRFDVLLGGEKLAGSAQRRTRHAVLQHGSIILATRYAQQPVATIASVAPWSAQDLAQRVAAQLAAMHALDVVRAEWTPDELAAASPHVQRHRADEWLKRI
jgi:lipoate-protein ligase A